MRKYVVELIGTFFLVLTIGCTVLSQESGVIPPLAIGSALMVMIFAGGHISGGHYNPAVTLAVYLRGRCDAKDVPGYMVAQIAGAVLAALAVSVITSFPNSTPKDFKVLPALVAEFLYTFALCYVVLNVATAKGTSGNSFYGLAIGFTVLVGAFSVGHISGGAFNPAVALGITSLGLQHMSNIWVFLVAEFAAAAAAASVFKFLNPGDP
ncbi:MAG: MIP/aquaporin family protein [Planctomycetaceae bacterium]